MKVFISWSGEESRRVAEQLRDWLPNVLQSVQPYYTPNDIEKGAKWSTEIFAELSSSAFGIVVLTRENLERPWVLFEAGALSARLHTKACPLLVGLSTTDISGPLAQLNATLFEKEDFRKLVATLNNELGDRRLDSAIVDRGFDKWWPDLEAAVAKISREVAASGPKQKSREQRDIIEEILATVRSIQRAQQPTNSAGVTLTTVSRSLARVFCEATLGMPANVARDDILDRLDSINTNYRKLLARLVAEDSSIGELLNQSSRAIRNARDEIPF